MAADADAAAGELKKGKTAKHPKPDAEKGDVTEEVDVDDVVDYDEAVEEEAEKAAEAEKAETAEDGEEGEEAHEVGPDADEVGADADATAATRVRVWLTPIRLAAAVGLVAVLSLGGLVGWLGVRTYEMRQDQDMRELFLRVGRQGAVNLTTIDWQNVNNDIQRILDSATGPFYEDFSKRSQPFIDVVKKVQSKSVGTVTEAGLESVSRNEARVLVAVSVKTSNLGAEDQPLRSWRMRLDVQRVDDGAKISNVLFVPA